jgi:hypothetical protein
MEKIINLTKKIFTVIVVTTIVTLWFLALCYSAQNTIF